MTVQLNWSSQLIFILQQSRFCLLKQLMLFFVRKCSEKLFVRESKNVLLFNTLRNYVTYFKNMQFQTTFFDINLSVNVFLSLSCLVRSAAVFNWIYLEVFNVLHERVSTRPGCWMRWLALCWTMCSWWTPCRQAKWQPLRFQSSWRAVNRPRSWSTLLERSGVWMKWSGILGKFWWAFLIHFRHM